LVAYYRKWNTITNLETNLESFFRDDVLGVSLFLVLSSPNLESKLVSFRLLCTGTTVLLIADQVLWFGANIPTSLINPHQLRDHGLGVCDDPWDPYRAVGIESDKGFIPFSSQGTTLYFEMRSPTTWELDSLPIILLTAPRWNPHDFTMPKGTVSVFSTVRSMESIQPCENFSETDYVLGTISPALDTHLLATLPVLDYSSGSH
jgi:hypothetical protein